MLQKSRSYAIATTVPVELHDLRRKATVNLPKQSVAHVESKIPYEAIQRW
jgi:hypothetical protein